MLKSDTFSVQSRQSISCSLRFLIVTRVFPGIDGRAEFGIISEL